MPDLKNDFTVRGIFRNQANDQVEELSPSPKTTPRDKKKPLGPIKSFKQVDEQIFSVFNKEGEQIDLTYKNLRPSILVGSDTLKDTLVQIQDKSLPTFISVMQRFLEKFSEPIKTLKGSQADMFASDDEESGEKNDEIQASSESGLGNSIATNMDSSDIDISEANLNSTPVLADAQRLTESESISR